VKPIILLTSFCLSLCAVSAHADNDSPLRDAGIARGLQLAEVGDPEERKVYIVQLRTPSAAEYYSALRKTSAPMAVQKLPRVRFDKASPAIESYTARLLQLPLRLQRVCGPDDRHAGAQAREHA
jgi:hypothetical protein